MPELPEGPITLDELRRDLHDAEEALATLIDCIMLMPAGFLPDERHDLLAHAATVRRMVRAATALLEQGEQ
jgi:hypothetical protein